MTVEVTPTSYSIETKTAVIGETVEIPYHAEGITIRQILPFGDTVEVSYLMRNDLDQDEDAINHVVIHELVFGLDELDDVELPCYAFGTSIFSPDDDESTFLYYLT